MQLSVKTRIIRVLTRPCGCEGLRKILAQLHEKMTYGHLWDPVACPDQRPSPRLKTGIVLTDLVVSSQKYNSFWVTEVCYSSLFDDIEQFKKDVILQKNLNGEPTCILESHYQGIGDVYAAHRVKMHKLGVESGILPEVPEPTSTNDNYSVFNAARHLYNPGAFV